MLNRCSTFDFAVIDYITFNLFPQLNNISLSLLVSPRTNIKFNCSFKNILVLLTMFVLYRALRPKKKTVNNLIS